MYGQVYELYVSETVRLVITLQLVNDVMQYIYIYLI